MKREYLYNYRLIIEYDGAGFYGWQKQPGLSTVQGELESALQTILRTTEISGLQAAGRTDSGVHALGQVVNFRCNLVIDLHVLKHAVSNILKNRLSVLHADLIDMGFNALHSATARQYRYVILNRLAPAVLDKGRVWHIVPEIDLAQMKHDSEMPGWTDGLHKFSRYGMRQQVCCKDYLFVGH